MEISWVRWPAGLAQSVCSRFRGNPVSKVRQRAIEEDTSILDLSLLVHAYTHMCTHTRLHTQECANMYTLHTHNKSNII